ncbi:hypothetical protein [Pseudonocardia sp. H11422]|uniref:hypothetical protein n=1 Tax=Pseudonocardia sp. H11422 TaxID=2835866 RepID=UPI001BDD20D4|nr:hypothetical protein [Pseudonocardia sp. H11422]
MDDEWVPEATSLAMARILEHAELVGLANTEEFTFRSFFMAAACELLDKPRFQTEVASTKVVCDPVLVRAVAQTRACPVGVVTCGR